MFMSERWLDEIRTLRREGMPGQEILQAFEVALQNAPDKVGFFPQDFPRWRRIALEARHAAAAKQQQEEQSRQTHERAQTDQHELVARREEVLHLFAKMPRHLRVPA